jgi:hypothetical protein
VLLKLLADLGTDGGNGHVQRVHGLDLGGLKFLNMNTLALIANLYSDALYKYQWHPRSVPRSETGHGTERALERRRRISEDLGVN